MIDLLQKLNISPKLLALICSITVGCSGSLEDVSELTGQNALGSFGSESVKITPTPVLFGEVTAGVGISTETIGIFNNYGDSLKVISLTPSSEDLTIVNNTCVENEAPVDVKPEATCNFDLKLVPTSVGEFSATVDLVFRSDGNNHSETLEVTANISSLEESLKQNSLNLDITDHNYGLIVSTIQSASKTFTLTNKTDSELFLTTFSDLDSTNFKLASNTCLQTNEPIAIDATCTFDVKFAPQTVGTLKSTLAVNYGVAKDGSELSLKLNLSGTSVSVDSIGNTAISYAPTSFDFPNTATASGSDTKTLTLKNASDLPVYISTISGLSGSLSILSHNCPLSPTALVTDATCTVTVKFQPATGGGHSGTLTTTYGLVDGSFGYNAIAGITGTGVSPLNFDGIDSITPYTTSTATLNWTNIAGASSYYIFNTTSGTPTLITNVAAGSTSYQVTGLSTSTLYKFRVNGIDGLGGLDTNTNDVTVTTKNTGTFTAVVDFSGAEAATFASAALSCTDSYASTPSYSIQNQSDTAANCTIVGSTVSCTPSYKTGHSSWTSDVTVDCLLNGATISDTVTVTVNDTNRPPVLDSISNDTIVGLAAITVVDSDDSGDDADVDLDALTYSCTIIGDSVSSFTSVTNCNTGSAPVINTSNGQVSWTTIISHAQATDETYTITVTADDGSLTDTETFQVAITAPTPLINSVSNYYFKAAELVVGTPMSVDFYNTRGGANNDIGITYSCTFQLGYPNGSPVSCDSFPDGTNPLGASNGTFSFTPSNATIGSYNITVTATNSAGADSSSFTMMVRSDVSQTNLLGSWDAAMGGLNQAASSGASSTLDLLNTNDLDIFGAATTTVSGDGSSDSPYSYDMTSSDYFREAGNIMDNSTGVVASSWLNLSALPSSRTYVMGTHNLRNISTFELNVSELNPGFITGYVGPESYEVFLISENPIGYWRLDENSGTTFYDSSASANVHDATYANTIAYGLTAGIAQQINRGKSITVADSSVSYPIVPYHAELEFTDNSNDKAFSVSTWAKIDSGNSNGSGIFGRGSEYNLTILANDLTFRLIDSDGGNQDIIIDQTNVPFGSWAHYAITYDGRGGATAYQGMKIYINGTEMTPDTFTADAGYVCMETQGSGAFNIGSSGTGSRLNGSLDEFALFDYELSKGQVTAHYERGSGIRSPNSVLAAQPEAYWRFGESEGTTAHDISGNGHDGVYENINLNHTGALISQSSPDGDNAIYSTNSTEIFSAPLSETSFLNGATAASMSVWIKPNSTSSRSYLRIDDNGQRFSIFYYDGFVHFTVTDGTTQAERTIAVPDANWHHYLIAYDGSRSTDALKFRTYIDGSEVTGAAGTVPANLATFTTKLRFYSEAGLPAKADEFALFDYQLSPTQAENIYSDAAFRYCMAPKPITTDDWNHIAVRYGTTNELLSLWVNGDKKCETTVSASIDSANYPLSVGRVDGKLGAFSVYQSTDGSDPLTDAQVADLYSEDAYRYGKSAYSVNYDGTFETSSSGPSIFSTMDAAEEFSVSLWFKVDNEAGTRYLFASGGGGTSSFYIRKRSDHLLEMAYAIDGTYMNLQSTKTVKIKDGWTNLVITKPANAASGNVKFYFNGIEDTLSIQNDNLSGSATSGDFFIGSLSAGSPSFFRGSIDNVAIFDAELTALQALNIYNGGVPRSLEGHANIVNWWPMGDGDVYPTLLDRVGSSHLTFTNGDSADITEEYPK
jgi:hypothetical protein